jgi:hypothetical protein
MERQMNAQPKPIGPTLETRRHGDYVRPEGKGALAVYTNRHPDILAKLHAHATLTERLYKAGRAFEGTWCIVRGHGSPSRDSTIPPIGGIAHETEGQAERWANANGRLKVILQKIGPLRYNLLIGVCCFGESLGPTNRAAGRTTRDAFIEALEVCAYVYGIERS